VVVVVMLMLIPLAGTLVEESGDTSSGAWNLDEFVEA
jgi:hypothetical protein